MCRLRALLFTNSHSYSGSRLSQQIGGKDTSTACHVWSRALWQHSHVKRRWNKHLTKELLLNITHEQVQIWASVATLSTQITRQAEILPFRWGTFMPFPHKRPAYLFGKKYIRAEITRKSVVSECFMADFWASFHCLNREVPFLQRWQAMRCDMLANNLTVFLSLLMNDIYRLRLAFGSAFLTQLSSWAWIKCRSGCWKTFT